MQPNPLSYSVPYPLSLILCDTVYTEPQTGKKALIGLFSELKAPGFPVFHPGFCVYLAFSDCEGTVRLKLRIVDVDEERDPIVEAVHDIQVSDRRAVMEMVWTGGAIVFPAAGEYRIQTFAGDEPLLERRLVVAPTQPPASEP